MSLASSLAEAASATALLPARQCCCGGRCDALIFSPTPAALCRSSIPSSCAPSFCLSFLSPRLPNSSRSNVYKRTRRRSLQTNAIKATALIFQRENRRSKCGGSGRAVMHSFNVCQRKAPISSGFMLPQGVEGAAAR